MPMYDDYDDEIGYYDDLLDDIEEQEQEIEEMYQDEIDEIDEYWDKENEYIRNSGIYTDEEVRSILEEHERIRNSKKEDAKGHYEFEKEGLEFDREDALFQRKMAIDDMEFERQLEEEALDDYQPQPQPQLYQHYERPSLLKRLMTFGGAYILFEKMFFPKK